MNAEARDIADRLSLRAPQRESLAILERACELVELRKDRDPAAALAAIRSVYPSVEDFERGFPSLCFALATGVGKTRLMGAFMAYLHRVHSIRHFFVLAPNLTIHDKLLGDFSPEHPKYVFRGVREFATEPPVLVTGDNYEGGRGLREDLAAVQGVVINVFNISKINAETRGGKSPRIKRLQEYIGASYFDYLASLPDLVLLMDESHRYRASAGVRVLNELNPLLGLELTATPQVEAGGKKPIPFRNVVYSYPLANALRDGFVKEPAVATREDFDPASYDEAELERIKLEDGAKIHENAATELRLYAADTGAPLVKPFMLVVARDTKHAEDLRERIEADEFRGGAYRGRVVVVHSNQSGEEKDETVKLLLEVERAENPVEIVIHVNMLKEGWDVTNLYTIVPLRTASSKTLVEQSVGRGLRLPFGRRTGNPDVDRLTIVAHDRFQEIVDEANRPDSIIRTGVVVGRDVASGRPEIVRTVSAVEQVLLGGPADPGRAGESGGAGAAGTTEGAGGDAASAPRFTDAAERELARAALEVLPSMAREAGAGALLTEEGRARLAERIALRSAFAGSSAFPLASALSSSRPNLQYDLIGAVPEERSELVLAEVAREYASRSMDVPNIVFVPKGAVKRGFEDFELDLSDVRPMPVSEDILLHHLRERTRHVLEGIVDSELDPVPWFVEGLREFHDVNYDENAPLLDSLARRTLQHLRSYLRGDDEVVNVFRAHRRLLLDAVHSRMQAHFVDEAGELEARLNGYRTIRTKNYRAPEGGVVRNLSDPVDERRDIRGMLFGDARKSVYSPIKFDTDFERRLAVVFEQDSEVIKWVRPDAEDVRIEYRRGSDSQLYEPDFLVETAAARYVVEAKRDDEMEDDTVLAKSRAAATWCEHATKLCGVSWSHLLIPNRAIQANSTMGGLAAGWTKRS